MENYNLLENIINGIKYLLVDFISLSINPLGILHVLLNIITSLSFIFIFLLLGKKIRKSFLNDINNNELNYFVDISLGYIFFGTAIAILGSLSILYKNVLIVFLLGIFFLALYPLSNLWLLVKDITILLKKIRFISSANRWLFLGICIFLVISFLRLIPPEIGEDAIGYHTDLPRLYLKNHSMIMLSKEPQRVLPAPQLGEMSYVITEFLGVKDASRYLHFMFYILVVAIFICWGYQKKNNFLGLYSALLFVTASVVIRIASKANVDYQWIYCWLVSVFVILETKKRIISNIALSAVAFGGVMATKLWTIAFLPIFLIYILIIYKIKKRLTYKLICIFVLLSILVSSLWYLRSFIITGDPFYPAFTTTGIISRQFNPENIFAYIRFNVLLFSLDNLIAFSPLFFLSILFIFLKSLARFKIIKKNINNKIFIFFSLLVGEHLIIQYYLGRYLLGLYSIGVIMIAFWADKLMLFKGLLFKIIFIFFLVILAGYYFSSTLLILPYGFGWADKNKYLTRVLYRDNASYFDFDGKFNKFILKDDKVATFEIFGFYYASFDYIDANYIFDKKNRSFDLLVKKGVTKLLIKGGDVLWFCQRLTLNDCNYSKVKLLISYPEKNGKFNLYSIIKSY